MPAKLYLDIETFSRADLKRVGLAKYAEDSSTDLLCVCWATDDGNVKSWIPSGPDDECPTVLAQHINSGAEIHAWNYAFERVVLNGVAGRRYRFPELKIANGYCSMVNARVHGLPGGLDACAQAIGAPRKNLSGVAAMRYLCKPRQNGTRPTIEEEPERFRQLTDYCKDDVYIEREIDRLIPRMSDDELRIYRELDQPMNDLGWKVDLASVDNFEVLVSVYKKELEKRCLEMTGIRPSQAGKLADWIRANGYPELEDLQADTVRKALLSTVPDNVRTILALFSTYNMKAPAKFSAMRNAACSDNRVRHMFMMYGAGPGRWSSTIVQLQNLMRPVIDDPETAVEAAREWDLGWIRALYPGVDPMKIFGSCVRSCLIADEGKELLFPDFAGIEARWNAWIWGEESALEAYRKQDAGTGPDGYTVTYSKCFGVPLDQVDKKSRNIGKALILAFGYGGGVGAFVKAAATYRVDLKDMEKLYETLPKDIVEESVEAYHYADEQGRLYELSEKLWISCEAVKRLWRRAHPKIVAGWKSLEENSILAVTNPGKIYSTAGNRLKFKTEGDFLVMRLPSGRKIYYYKPQVRDNVLHYQGMNTATRIWGPTSTYGGRQCQNETEGGCRDLLTTAKFKLKALGGLDLLGSIHDEPVFEMDGNFDQEDDVRRLMCENEDWNQGLPLAVEIHRGKRYRKG